MDQNLRVTVWNEGVHEKDNADARAVYPDGMGHTLARYLEGNTGIGTVRVAQLEDPHHGLTEDVLAETDVLTWWGHLAHDRVADDIVDKVIARVWEGMGFVPLHSAHFSKPFRRLMGTGCMLRWRDNHGRGEKERVWVVDPAHPIAEGVPQYFELPQSEMYGEHFDIPQPDRQVFLSWFQGGDVFRSGCCWHRGQGKIFYFSPGHETFPIYHDETVLHIIHNGIRWAAPSVLSETITRGNVESLERLD